MRTAIYPGSFDPVTFGHLDIIERSSRMFDRLIVGVLNNSAKKSLFTAEERVDMIKSLTRDFPNVEVDSFDGLTIDFAMQKGAVAMIRGLRAVTDFEYELQIAQTNRVESPEIDTIFLTTSLKYSYLSSTIVKEFASYGGDISRFVPEEIIPLIMEKVRQGGLNGK
ncbi:MAG: pantetheine-phosphate adenylyltransferase [Lachnospiraceae bacterium]|uniref:Phosphopantetheine adenylyltransferase n=1 Tax=Candidatus Weimeria bifida TaxID=2599074 RepID=A0A6N7IYV4_9FIRM|nr:pantetheine-phosphate adenylyltransferase [Candidatus Weimeria bifida]RRF96969.1 MAG: pantetheine-phosphate adenylyltransferase [Lachnospiraceae bacterium]